MSPENLPFSYSQTLQNCISLFRTQFRIRVNGRHQDRCVLVVFRLFRGKAVCVYINITCKCYVIGIIDQNDLSGQMPAFAFINFKVKLTKAEEAYLRQRFFILVGTFPLFHDFIGLDRLILSQYLTDVNVRSMQRVFFSISI